MKAATGEVVTAEELGGGDVHARLSGVVDHLAEDDAACAGDRARRSCGRSTSLKPREPPFEVVAPEEPPGRPAEIYGIVPPIRARRTTSARSSRASSTPAASTSSRRATATTLVCGFAHIHGYPVGIIANNGVLFSESALKGAHFIELCYQRGVPLLFLQNITGFMVGEIRARRHRQGRREDGPRGGRAPPYRSTVVIGGSYGAGNYGMCGRAYEPRFLCMWPKRASR